MPLLRALTRVAAEIGGRLDDREVDDAKARAIGGLTRDPDGAVRVPHEAYASVPTREARVAVLREAIRQAARVVLIVPVVDAKTHVGRVAFDAPRVVLRALGVPAREPGDRLERGAFMHCFFDEEALRSEIAEAGLVVAARRGSTFVLERGAPLPEEPDDFARELVRAARLVRLADATRRGMSPERAIEHMRARGSREIARGPIGRARLRRAIGWVDALVPGGENCYRRVLLELALDAGAARETVVLGLDVGRTGHIAFEGREDMPFDVAFEIPAETRSGP